MFTGLIQTLGTLRNLASRGNYRILSIESTLAGEALQVGESISCDGACLTVKSFDRLSFEVEVTQETIRRTIISGYKIGRAINLERSVKTGERLGGHLVNGHVDCTGTVNILKSAGESLELAVSYDLRYDLYVVGKGSVTLNGVSLTVNDSRPGWLAVNIIPHTAEMTNLGRLKSGQQLNIEFDIIGKYVAKMLDKDNTGKLTAEKLRESGW
jgi:riboflavin synthase